MPYRQLGLPEALRCRLAYHWNRRRFWRGRSLWKIIGAVGAADAVGIGTRRDSAGRPSRNVWLDDQEFPSWARGAERPHGGAACFEKLHELGTESRSEVWLG